MDGDPMPQTIVEKIAQMHMAEGPSRPLRTGDFLSIRPHRVMTRSEEHTSELQSPCNLVCRLLLEKKKKSSPTTRYSFRSPLTQNPMPLIVYVGNSGRLNTSGSSLHSTPLSSPYVFSTCSRLSAS